MNILVFAQHYFPEEISGAVLATELAEFLVQDGHQVTFVTCVPNYPYGKEYKGYKNRLIFKEKIRGVNVLRVWSYISPKKTFWRRILNYGTFSLFAVLGGLLAHKPDMIFAYSPPLPLGVTAWLVSRIKGVPWVLRVEDLYPDAAVAAGVLRNRFAIRFFYWLEKFIYRRADRLSVISDGFKQIVKSKGIPDAKIHITPVWANPDTIVDNGMMTDFRRQQGLNNCFIVLYAGNLGQTSDLETVIDSAQHLQDHPQIHFVIVGEGIKKKSLVERAEKLHLRNLRFLPYQPREKFGDMMTSANLLIVTLNPDSSGYSIPGKTFNYMASSRAILAVAPRESEYAQLIRRYRCGVIVEPGNAEAIAGAILAASRNQEELDQMGKNGRLALEQHFAKDVCLDQIELMLVNAQ